MPEALTKLLNQAREFWAGLEKSQKTRLYITSALVVVAITVSIIMLTRPSYMTLVKDADQKQIGEMSSVLNENQIWNSVEGGGTSIKINMRDNNKAQVALAQKGYPKEGLTFEDAISLIGIGTTESDKKKIWEQQRVSNIEAKIKMLDNIEDASVSLAMPEKSIFYNDGEEQPQPKAHVMVKPNEKLTPKQVEGIVMLVASSVEGLEPKDVTVADSNSNILNANSGDEAMDLANSQEELRVKREKELEGKVQDYFSVGQFDNFDTLRVVANVALDFDKEKTQSKILANPDGMDGGAVISSDITKEKLENGSVNGVPGTDTNPGDTNSPSYPVGGDSNSNYSKTSEKINYGYNETLKDHEKATGKMIPEESSMAISLWYGNKVKDESKLTNEFLDQIKLAASTATGIPAAKITVNKLKLAQPEIVQKPTTEVIRDLINDYGFFALMLILIFGLLIMAIPRRKKEEEPELAPAMAAAAAAGGPKFIVPEPGDPIPEIELEERSEIKKQIEKFVKQKPDAVAQLLRNWLSDEWDG